MRYGMVIDLKRCAGCNSCTVACRAEKGTPPGILYHRVEKYEAGKYPAARMQFRSNPLHALRGTGMSQGLSYGCDLQAG